MTFFACATAKNLSMWGVALPTSWGVEYVGLDISDIYIQAARAKFKTRGGAKFLSGSVEDWTRDPLTYEADLVLTNGVLHRVDDDDAKKILEFTCRALKDNGRFIFYEPCYLIWQSGISAYFMSLDRGQNIRTEQQWKELASSIFPVGGTLRLFRSDLMLTGPLFERQIDAQISFHTGPFHNPGCRLEDLTDSNSMKMRNAFQDRPAFGVSCVPADASQGLDILPGGIPSGCRRTSLPPSRLSRFGWRATHAPRRTTCTRQVSRSAFRGDKTYRRPSSLLYGLGRLRRHPGAEKGDLDACAPERAPTRDSVGTRQRRFVPT